MDYPCVPAWMKEREKDPFDYPLRTKKEIMFEQYANPPLFTMKIIKNSYVAVTGMTTLNVHKADNRNNEVTLEGNINEMFLTPLQKKRLIFLLGPRWKGDGKVKIVSKKYTSLEHNISKGLDIFRQLYWEAKRAPMYIWSRMKNKERRIAAVRILGKHPPEKMEQLKAQMSEEMEKKKQMFDHLYDNGEYTPEVIKQNVQNHLDIIFKGKFQTQQHSQEEIQENAKRTEELIARDNIEKNLVKKQILTKKAYDTFFNKENEE